MQVVADYLVTAAKGDAEHFDLFARSAFNRYYYACFLLTRSMCGQVDPHVTSIAHKRLPQHLRETVAKHFKLRIKPFERAQHTHRGASLKVNLNSLKNDVLTSLDELAGILESAYAVRVVADYDPDIVVECGNNNNFLLAGKSLQEAAQWVRRVAFLVGRIRSDWKQLP